MSQTAVYSISRSGSGLEQAFAGLYREAQREVQIKRRRGARADLALALCNAGTWLYTLASLMHHV